MKKSGQVFSGDEVYDDIWDALFDSPIEAANLRARSELMLEIERILKQSGWTQVESAKRCGVSQPRINDLLRGRIDKFSVDALVNIAASLGVKVRLDFEAA